MPMMIIMSACNLLGVYNVVKLIGSLHYQLGFPRELPNRAGREEGQKRGKLSGGYERGGNCQKECKERKGSKRIEKEG